MTDKPCLSRKMAFLMTPGFALTSFSLAIEALSVANALMEEDMYDVHLFGAKGLCQGLTVTSSNGVAIQVEGDITLCQHSDSVFICAYLGAPAFNQAETFKQLKLLHHQGVRMASLSSGSFLLAKMGLLKGRRCTVYDEQALSFSEMYPASIVQNTIFTVDASLLSCAGGTSALDMVLYIIAQDFGKAFAQRVSERFIQDRVRSFDEIQHSQRYLSLRAMSPILAAAIEIMDNNLDETISIESLCDNIGTTARTLEKIFQRFLQVTPKKYYLNVRLTKALYLLKNTHFSISSIAQSTGFSSQSYFSKCFKETYATSPQKIRNQ